MRISIIGSGNVATHIGAAFKNAGHRITQVYSRDLQRAALLAYHLGAQPVNNLGDITSETDLFVIAVKDEAISGIAQNLAAHGKLIVHTSGTTDLQTILYFTHNAGVLYPLQTFSKNKEVDFKVVPLCVEGADEEITAVVEALALTISNNVQQVSSEQRKTLHLAAVFACNFSNCLYAIAAQLLNADQLNFALLRPLILETAQKVQQRLPLEVQTGPAVRNDLNTMDAHLKMLDNAPALKTMYELLSQEIIKNSNTERRA